MDNAPLPRQSEPAFSAETRDKIVGWTLNLFVAVALSVGAYFFSRLDEKLEKLTDTLGDLRLEVAKAAEQRTAWGDRMIRLEARMSDVEGSVRAHNLDQRHGK